MNPLRRQKLSLIVFIAFILAIALGLIMYAFRQNISLFYTPSDLQSGQAPIGKMIRMGGMVVKNSVQHQEGLAVQFKLTDFKQVMTVHYEGILPDLFREGQGIVAMGELIDKNHFKAIQVLAKHDANYMPPEVKQALAKKVVG